MVILPLYMEMQYTTEILTIERRRGAKTSQPSGLQSIAYEIGIKKAQIMGFQREKASKIAFSFQKCSKNLKFLSNCCKNCVFSAKPPQSLRTKS